MMFLLLTDRGKDLCHIHARLGRRLHKQQVVLICVRLCVLCGDGTLGREIELVSD